MGKVKDAIVGDVEGLTEWVKRKLTNHDPMSVRDSVKGGKRTIEYAPHTNSALHYCTADGKVFEIQVREVNQEARKPYRKAEAS